MTATILVRKTALFGLLPMLATALLAFAAREWNSKADRTELDQKADQRAFLDHVNARDIEKVRDSAWKADQRALTIEQGRLIEDIWCQSHPNERRCRS